MKPGLLMLPSAVSDSRVHNILPNKIETDFQFSRASAATRVNHQGLIEELGYFSSELVQNGNFSELGSEKATNGNFDNGSTNWTLIGDVSIGNGVCTFFDTGSNTNSQLISQTGILANKTYKLVFDVTRYVAGSIQIIFGGGSAVSVNITGGVGTYTVYVVNGSSTTWLIKRNGSYPNFDFDIDNVSVKQVDPNDRFELDSASYGQNKVTLTSVGGAMTYIKQTGLNLEANKTYLIEINATRLSGDTNLALGSDGTNNVSGSPIISTSGFKRYYFTPASNIAHIGIKRNFGGSGAVWEITSFSIVEVQGDKPRLNYDPTNLTCPHLLLEPQSTNLAKFSYNIQGGVDSGDYIKGSNSVLTYVSDVEAPDGTMGVYRLQNPAQSGTFLSFYTGNSKNISVYVKAVDVNNNNQFSLYRTGVASSVFTATSDWKRYSFEYAQSTGNAGINNEGDAYVSDVYIWGAQVEDANSYATSLIPTAGATATRVAETCNNAGNADTFNSAEGVLYAEVAALANDQTARFYSISDGSSSNRIRLGFQSGTSNRFRALVVSGSSSTVDMNDADTTLSDITQYNKIAFKYKANDFALYFNGTEVKTDTSGAVPTSLNLLEFNNAGNTLGSFFYGKVKSLATYNRALTDTELYTITSTQYSAYSGMVAALGNYTIPC